MLLSRALSRVSNSRRALTALQQNLQRPSICSQFHSFVHQSPKKFVANDGSLLHHSSLNFNAFQRYGIASSASPDPSGKDNEKPSGYALLGEAEVANQAKKSDSVIDADILKDDILKLGDEIIEVLEAMKKDGMLIKTVTGMDVDVDVEEIKELMEARQKLVEELDVEVVKTLLNINVAAKKYTGILGYFRGLFRKSSLDEIDIASLHEQLQFVRKHFSHLKLKIEENRNDLRLKLEELREELESHQVEKETNK